ncbi:Crp/Fnr family transcriptional regulator [Chryseobacterium polytrichastri]|uniref:cAMP-binding domain of CRP or a regulatory subunit of cAMP-dependent protein kinases n=1 Tax=Chryseobacterium polytrichastri TaxID=1302687 RepID=A0A1M7J6N2_9FLAO|nr:Crp/Fnr family transcriptional regulator [Chryseobacterium polytrichastri]SHM48533.1 cAMP-binding domain of CRP or a regulatory subunit of cAMP-dependent protein kinases [Chryseobacterium polytrichastri]
MSLELRKHLEELISLTDEEFEHIHSFFKFKKLKKHQYLIQENELVTTIYFVTKGLLKASFIDKEGKEHIIQFAMENWWISDFQSFYNGMPSVINIDCLEEVELCSISKENLEKMCSENHKMEHFFRVKNSFGYVALQQRILSLLTTNAKERFEQFSHQYPQLIQRIPKAVIASYLGVSRETLSRISNKL